MKNLFLTLTLFASTGILAQEEIVRLQVIFDECNCLWEETNQDSISWEVWSEGVDFCSCWEMSKDVDDKPHITSEYIFKEIEKNRDRTDLHEGSFILWFPVYELGVYHIGVRNNISGELLGNTVVRVGHETIMLLDNYGDFGFTADSHLYRLIQTRIADENTIWYGGGCPEEYYPGNFVPN